MKRMVKGDVANMLDGVQINNGNVELNTGLSVDGTLVADGVKADGYLAPKSTTKAFFDGTFEQTLTIADQTLKDSSDNELGTLSFPFVHMRISNGKLSVICCLTFDITATGTPTSISFSAQAKINDGLLAALVPIDTSLPYGVLDKRLIPSIPGTAYQIAQTSNNGYQYIRTATDSYNYLIVSGYIAGAAFTATGKYFIRYEANFII